MFYVLQLMDGPRFKRVFPENFKRGSQALAHLIDHLRERDPDVQMYYEHDKDNPGCYDMLADFGGNIEQYAVNEEQ